MAKDSDLNLAIHQPKTYQIRLEGHLSQRWQNSFEGFEILLEEEGTTLLIGAVIDQSALYGMLRKVRDLGLPLISLNCVTHKTAVVAPKQSEQIKDRS
ncbi:MAG: hypothetical protein AAF490_21675 [Chloroflexota bacterium]